MRESGHERPRELSIRSCERQMRLASKAYRAVMGPVAFHSFLMLVDETNPENPVPYDELHFMPVAGNGVPFLSRQSFISNGFNAAAACAGIQPIFHMAAKASGQGDKLYYLQAARHQPRKPHKMAKLHTYSYNRGAYGDMLRDWNTALALAVDITASRQLFTFADIWHGAANCRAGTKAVLEGIGYEFKDAVDHHAWRGKRVHLLERALWKLDRRGIARQSDVMQGLSINQREDRNAQLKAMLPFEERSYGVL